MTVPSDTSGVPLIDLQAQWATIGQEVLQAIERVAASQQLILGPEVQALEEELAAFIGCSHAIGVSSGTDALLLALIALDIQAGDEVVTTPFTFFSTGGSIARLGARPVFVDIQPDTFNLDPDPLAAAITSRTRAILPVHLFGQIAEMDPIQQIARDRNLPVIEDAAQAIGADYHGRSAGTCGDIGCFSFYPTKNLGGLGDGGLVTTDRSDLNERLRLLRNHGFRPKYHAREVGGNFRLDALQAAALRVKLQYLDRWNRARADNADVYRRLLRDAQLSSDRVTPGKVVVPVEPADRRHIYHQFVIRVTADQRDPLRAWLADRGIGTEIYYPVPLHLQECFAGLGYRAGDFPVAEAAAAQSLALPIYPELTVAMQQRVVEAIAGFFATGS
ncbi:MAG: aminotransferase class V-fold PLP-dependent enzyme [Planctomycetales bacterium]|nr:aminotransferase class V-fold PLP-dependent enzyme [Planctomycetales bacterium]NIM07965.1 aminotransferase class V-fold PLP-dependent enzyme [Planctomycetales bacterium]NIN07443.1 aminotransferase class V-fold PLP-dependent enzyme [Planctomycetales bacterium]NIN76550.1 aminotransferase class V-fold PLP-dependent enzyme [Planctomycetales bacterium]NIO33737.1 aminotransferase class V-fold PLP-dependent enzyme [Planctomycetales bacterium]